MAGGERIVEEERALRRARVRRTLLIITLGVMLVEWALIVAFATQLSPPHVSDFGMYYAAAMLLRHNPGGDIYSAAALLKTTATFGGCPQMIAPAYVYPPLLAIALEPLTYLTCAQALVVWTLLNAALWALSAAMMVDLLRRAWPQSRLGLWALVITACAAFWPAYPGLFLGQSHLLVLFLMLSGIWLERRERPWLAGVALVLAALVKPPPALLLVYYLARGRWAVVGGALVAGVALLAVMLVGSSPATLIGSLMTTFSSTSSQAHPGKDEALMMVAGPAGVGVAIMAAAVFIVTLIARKGADRTLGAAWTICAMLLISPVVWPFYLVWLLPVLAIVASDSRLADRHRPIFFAALGAIYVILAAPFLAPAHSIATLALWVLCGALYWRSGERRGAEAASAAIVVT